MKVDFYGVFMSYIIYYILFYNMTMLTPFFLTIFVAYLIPGEGSSGIIGHKGSSWESTSIHMNGGGQNNYLIS